MNYRLKPVLIYTAALLLLALCFFAWSTHNINWNINNAFKVYSKADETSLFYHRRQLPVINEPNNTTVLISTPITSQLQATDTVEMFDPHVPRHVAANISALYHKFKAKGSIVNDIVTTEKAIIPNIFHYVRFNQSKMRFHEMLSVRSVLKLGNPELVYIHTNEKPSGQYWDMIKDDSRIKVTSLDPPKSVFGKEYGWIQHASDLARIQVLLKYGGTYMDNDCIVINEDLERLRKHHCVVSKSSKERHMGNMFMMSTKDCVFFRLYLELYRLDYNRDGWYYNGGELPQYALIDQYPGLVYLTDEGVEQGMLHTLWGSNHQVLELQKSYRIIHLFYGHKDYTYNDTTEYDMDNIKYTTNTFSRIARWLLYDHEEPF